MERILKGGLTLAAATLLTAVFARAEGAKFVGRETCASCHAEADAAFDKTFHGRKAKSDPRLSKACESCHGPGSEHVDGGGDKSKILNPKNMAPEAVAQSCMTCHKDKSLMMWKTGPHATADVSCLTCHSVHKGSGNKSLTNGATDSCLNCHKKQKADMRLASHHPVLEGKMTCASCHNPHGGIEGNLKGDSLEETCAKCHTDKMGPFMHEHPPVADGCQNCHLPHGSTNERMLKMPIQYLCISCHNKEHTSLTTAAGTTQATWVQRDRCTDCHREIHGSDRARRFRK